MAKSTLTGFQLAIEIVNGLGSTIKIGPQPVILFLQFRNAIVEIVNTLFQSLHLTGLGGQLCNFIDYGLEELFHGNLVDFSHNLSPVHIWGKGAFAPPGLALVAPNGRTATGCDLSRSGSRKDLLCLLTLCLLFLLLANLKASNIKACDLELVTLLKVLFSLLNNGRSGNQHCVGSSSNILGFEEADTHTGVLNLLLDDRLRHLTSERHNLSRNLIRLGSTHDADPTRIHGLESLLGLGHSCIPQVLRIGICSFGNLRLSSIKDDLGALNHNFFIDVDGESVSIQLQKLSLGLNHRDTQRLRFLCPCFHIHIYFYISVSHHILHLTDKVSAFHPWI